MYTASDLRKGLRLKIDNEPYIITEFNFVKPGKGQALYRTKLKNMINGNQFERTFRSVDNFETADLREKKMQYLYKEGDKYCFMDNENYEQVYLTEAQVGDAVNFHDSTISKWKSCFLKTGLSASACPILLNWSSRKPNPGPRVIRFPVRPNRSRCKQAIRFWCRPLSPKEKKSALTHARENT